MYSLGFCPRSRGRPAAYGCSDGLSPARKEARRTTTGKKSARAGSVLSAVLRLQRWFRRDLWLRLWDRADVEVRYCMRVKGAVRIVEPSGQVYDFRARDLALMFIASGIATHPVTRRELFPTEMRRICRRLPARLSVLFLYTQKHREDAARAARQEHSLVSFLHAAAGASLDRAVCAAELDSDGSDLYALLDLYEHAIVDVVLQLPGSLHDLFRQHRSLLNQRERCCNPSRFDAVSWHLEYLKVQYVSAPCADMPRPAFVNWILEATR